MNVQLNNESEVEKLLIIALSYDNATSQLNNSQRQAALIRTIKPAYASLSTNWNIFGGPTQVMNYGKL